MQNQEKISGLFEHHTARILDLLQQNVSVDEQPEKNVFGPNPVGIPLPLSKATKNLLPETMRKMMIVGESPKPKEVKLPLKTPIIITYGSLAPELGHHVMTKIPTEARPLLVTLSSAGTKAFETVFNFQVGPNTATYKAPLSQPAVEKTLSPLTELLDTNKTLWQHLGLPNKESSQIILITSKCTEEQLATLKQLPPQSIITNLFSHKTYVSK